jgi:hypothetical protein
LKFVDALNRLKWALEASRFSEILTVVQGCDFWNIPKAPDQPIVVLCVCKNILFKYHI